MEASELAYAVIYALAGYLGARSTVRTIAAELRDLRAWSARHGTFTGYREAPPEPHNAP